MTSKLYHLFTTNMVNKHRLPPTAPRNSGYLSHHSQAAPHFKRDFYAALYFNQNICHVRSIATRTQAHQQFTASTVPTYNQINYKSCANTIKDNHYVRDCQDITHGYCAFSDMQSTALFINPSSHIFYNS